MIKYVKLLKNSQENLCYIIINKLKIKKKVIKYLNNEY